MGPVIRVSLCFQKKFWESDKHMRDLSFLFTDNEHFPTWWTSNPLPYPILTGWAAGRYALTFKGKVGRRSQPLRWRAGGDPGKRNRI